MNTFLKLVLPWLVAIALMAGAWMLYSAGQTTNAQLAGLRDQAAEADTLRAQNRELDSRQWKSEELARLRKDNEELLSLREELRRLREERAAAPPIPAARPVSPTPQTPPPMFVDPADALPEPEFPVLPPVPQSDARAQVQALQTIASSFLSFAEENNGAFPQTFEQLQEYLPEELLERFNAEAFEILAPANVLEIENPRETVLFRTRLSNPEGMRVSVYADGRLERSKE
jgi:hypothetical protein